MSNSQPFDPLDVPAYDESKFWNKVKAVPARAGGAILRPAFTLYFTLQDDDTPAWVKPVIAGALAYFIFPVDAIPDIIPVAGYTDDLGVLATALATTTAHVKPEHKEAANQQVETLLG